MRSEAERLSVRVTRIERLLAAIARGIYSDKMDKGIEYFMVGEDNDVGATREEVTRIIDEMEADMERSAQTGQV
jgi:hypothetical protein